jgi:hypothetical protein
MKLRSPPCTTQSKNNPMPRWKSGVSGGPTQQDFPRQGGQVMAHLRRGQ